MATKKLLWSVVHKAMTRESVVREDVVREDVVPVVAVRVGRRHELQTLQVSVLMMPLVRQLTLPVVVIFLSL
ncbi:hypothetical protein PC129_g11186 [Phytophthora cactorum]|nr:hypothetical protein PC114_g13754 [Phytophthora cactorum]KAG2977434.1 hypothetical protein PC118_g12887 [Phytophthora cactorum]KAG3218000.1 hypothetical protein PC129_g11186 [Phytophthora cactorum]RAW20915.1 hypothetical protein PC110_g22643 [Phytophthora cactorum]